MMGLRQWFATDVPGSQPLCACGKPLPFAELQIRNENNQPVPPGKRRPSAWSIVGSRQATSDGSMRTAASTCSTVPTTW
jgi:hypothetical protein